MVQGDRGLPPQRDRDEEHEDPDAGVQEEPPRRTRAHWFSGGLGSSGCGSLLLDLAADGRPGRGHATLEAPFVARVLLALAVPAGRAVACSGSERFVVANLLVSTFI